MMTRAHLDYSARAHPLLDLVCLSHLRWDSVIQRPQHLMTRAARERRVFFVEPAQESEGPARLDVRLEQGVRVCVPRLPHGTNEWDAILAQKRLMTELFRAERIHGCLLWYCTPMALPFTEHLPAEFVVYDCIEELSARHDPPPNLLLREAQLMHRADVVFTSGVALYESRSKKHPNVHAFPSSVDVAHLAAAARVASRHLDVEARQAEVDAFLATMSWERTWSLMKVCMVPRTDRRAHGDDEEIAISGGAGL